ncbi:polyprenyl glycosylphosphotransferase [Drancourtella sp. An12]|uniref:sugar transferase n=1 Tax=Drancourtella sp. An12 TaxID=1965548 RepID=UPI000B391376|nr:sugar transferase [Drancourtella sp. An12]OUQ42447.1 polyprenyl glycosylphosphotransferase [Drancourtella sp. An12]
MYKKSAEGWLKHGDFILLDLICLQAAFILACLCRYGMENPYGSQLYRNLAIFLVMADIVVVFFFETFKNVLKRGYYLEFSATLNHVIMVLLITTLYLFTIQEGSSYSRIVLYLTGVIYLFLTYVVRSLWKCFLHRKMKNGGKRSLLIVTTDRAALDVVLNIKRHNYEMYNLLGLVIADRDIVGEEIGELPVVANVDSAPGYVCRKWIDEVLLIPGKDESFPQSLIDKLIETGVTVHFHIAQPSTHLSEKPLVEKIGNYLVLTTSINYMTDKQAFLKRCLDIAGGLVGCILTGILFVFLAPAIYIQSPGPIFFSQVRVGKNGKQFKMYKFRSMYPDAEERKQELMKENRVKDGMMFKLDFDTRVIGNKILPNGRKKTGIGHLIRVTSIDEFPQFFNVLKGDMSLVGTRPPTLDEWEKYELHHRARLAIKPGITGMWQVSGRSEITDFEEVVRLDTEYITDWSVGMDFRILLKTVLAVVKKEGSM